MTQIKIDLSGLNTLLGQLKQLGADAEQAVAETVFDVATDTHTFAVQGIQEGPKTGITYYRMYDADAGYYKVYAGDPNAYGPSKLVAVFKEGGENLSPTHQASAPGQYPATDTGRLVSSVRMLPDVGTSYVVGTNVEYGRWLEFGTSRMAARPWLLPSFERAKIGVERELRARLEAKL